MFDTVVQRASACYVVERDEFSMVGAAFLDAYVFKPDNFQFHGKLGWRPHIKPTARHVPLHVSSNHPMSVHEGWPIAEIRRMHRLSCTRQLFHMYRQAKIERFSWFFMPSSVTHSCMKWTPRVLSSSVLRVSQNHESGLRVIRLMLPYHPQLAAGMNKAVSSVVKKWSMALERVVGSSFTVNTTWCKGGKPLHLVAKHGFFWHVLVQGRCCGSSLTRPLFPQPFWPEL